MEGDGRSPIIDMNKKIKKIVIAYSGGLDTSVAIRWLKEIYGCQVVAFCADLGQGEDLSVVKEKALKTGADSVYVEDLREEFVKDFVYPILRVNTVYEGMYLLGTSIARPLIAKKQMEIAEREGADAVAHGATGKGNDQVRFELAYLSLNPAIKIIAPWRMWELKSRSDLIAYAKRHNIPVSATLEKPYSIDMNLFHASYEGGVLEDPWFEPNDNMFLMTVSPEKAPDRPEYIEINYEGGNPVGINGAKITPAEIMIRLNRLGGEHGIGRVDLVENRYVGIKSRGVYETPGGTILHAAHRGVESITMDREVMHIRDSLMPKYAELIYYGYWFSPEREMLQKAFDEPQKAVTGTARLKLYKGSCHLVGRKAVRSLYSKDLATFEEESVYDQKDAEGFIRLNSLRLRMRAMQNKEG